MKRETSESRAGNDRASYQERTGSKKENVLQDASSGRDRFSGPISDEYPLWRLARPYLHEVHDAVSKRVRGFVASQNRRILAVDVGCGDGEITKILLESGNVDVVAIDNEPKMIEQAQARLSKWVEEGRLEIIQKDALHYLADCPSNHFDIVASGYVYHNMPACFREEVLREALRTLRSSGIFINADKYAQEGEAHYHALRWQMKKFFDVFGGAGKVDLLREWVFHYLDDEYTDKFMPEAQAIESMQRMGFTRIETIFRRHMDAIVIAQKSEVEAVST